MAKIYHNIIADCLKELSDKSYQQRVWTGSSPSEMSSFTEAAEQLYGGTGLHFAYKVGQPVYGKEIDDMLQNLRNYMKGMHNKGTAAQLIESEKMENVRKMAADILSTIQQKDGKDLAQNIKA